MVGNQRKACSRISGICVGVVDAARADMEFCVTSSANRSVGMGMPHELSASNGVAEIQGAMMGSVSVQRREGDSGYVIQDIFSGLSSCQAGGGR